MPRKPETRIAKLTRVTCQGQTLNFTMPALRRQRCPLTFVRPERVPPFEGDEAWFLMERVIAKPWSYWKAVRQVEPPEGEGRARA